MRVLTILLFVAGAGALVCTAPHRAEAQKPDDAPRASPAVVTVVPVIVPVEDATPPDAATAPSGTDTPPTPATPPARACDSTVDPCEPDAPPATHFLLEVDLGANLTGDLGVATGAVFGAGGSPPGWPLVFYFLGKVSQVSAGAHGDFADTGNYRDSRNYVDLSLGVRSYLRVWGPLRVFAEATVGAASSTASLERDGFSSTETDGVYLAFGLAGGFQVRIFHELSLGARVATLFADDGLSGFREALGIASPLPLLVQGSATWHF